MAETSAKKTTEYLLSTDPREDRCMPNRINARSRQSADMAQRKATETDLTTKKIVLITALLALITAITGRLQQFYAIRRLF